MNGMPQCQGWQRAAMLKDERSGFLFPTNPKYVHLGFGILRRSTCAILGFACTQCRGAMADFMLPAKSKYTHPCVQWQRAARHTACDACLSRGRRPSNIIFVNYRNTLVF